MAPRNSPNLPDLQPRRGSLLKPLLVIGVAVALGYAAYSHFMAPHPGGPGGMPPGGAPPVGVAEVVQHNVRVWSDFSGRLVAVDSAEIRPRVTGTIEKIHFHDGDRVTKGQKLFTIDQRPYEAAVEAANARAVLAAAEFGRAKVLLADKAISQHDYDQRKSDDQSARADLTQALLNLDYSTIRAPISGRAGRAELTVGNLVEAGGSAPVLTTIVSDKPIYADFEVDEASFLEYLQSVGSDTAKLAKVPVSLGLADEEGAPHEGHIESFDNQLDVRSGTIRVRAVFANQDGRLVPGLFARIRLGSADEAPALLIADRAVNTDQSKKFVLVVGPDNKVQYREVKIGGEADGLRIVLDGLKSGERIVVSGLQRARPGSEVKPEVVAMDAPDEAPPADQKPEK